MSLSNTVGAAEGQGVEEVEAEEEVEADLVDQEAAVEEGAGAEGDEALLLLPAGSPDLISSM